MREVYYDFDIRVHCGLLYTKDRVVEMGLITKAQIDKNCKFIRALCPDIFSDTYIRLRIYNSKYILKVEGGCDYVH